MVVYKFRLYICRMKEFKYIVAKYFFPKYAPEVVNWGHKLRGKNGHNKPIDFTDADKKAIKRGIKAMSKDLTI